MHWHLLSSFKVTRSYNCLMFVETKVIWLTCLLHIFFLTTVPAPHYPCLSSGRRRKRPLSSNHSGGDILLVYQYLSLPVKSWKFARFTFNKKLVCKKCRPILNLAKCNCVKRDIICKNGIRPVLNLPADNEKNKTGVFSVHTVGHTCLFYRFTQNSTAF